MTKIQNNLNQMSGFPQMNLPGAPRLISLSGPVDNNSVNPLVQMIISWNQEDAMKEQTLKNYSRPPIQLFVASPGGSVYDGFALVNAIVSSKTPVHGYCIGSAMSMGLVILVSCHKRFGYAYSSFMYHQLTAGKYGMLQELQDDVAVLSDLQKNLDKVIMSNTKIDKKKIKEINQSKKDWYFGVEEAKQLNVINEIIN